MKMHQLSEEVFYPDEKIVKVDHQDIVMLKEKGLMNKRQRSRLCDHNEVGDTLHEMLIIHTKDTYVRPHKHLNKSESFHIVEGSLNVILFDEEGQITDVIQMGNYLSGKFFL